MSGGREQNSSSHVPDDARTPWVVVEADNKQSIQREFAKGEIVDQFPSRHHSVFLVQSPSVPPLPNTVLRGLKGTETSDAALKQRVRTRG